MILFHSCNHALTPHFHQFTVLDAEQTPSVSNPLPNNSLERTGDAAPSARENEIGILGVGCEGAVPGRSARSRYPAFMTG